VEGVVISALDIDASKRAAEELENLADFAIGRRSA
jgi:hypothetical protein